MDSISVTVDLAASAASSNGLANSFKPGIADTKPANPVNDFTPKLFLILRDDVSIFPKSILNLEASAACSPKDVAISKFTSPPSFANLVCCCFNNRIFCSNPILSFPSF